MRTYITYLDEKKKEKRTKLLSLLMIVLGALLCAAGAVLIVFSPDAATLEKMPYLIGSDGEESVAILERSGLAVVVESGESSVYDEGMVISQSIDVGEKIEPGMTVTLIVNGGIKGRIKMSTAIATPAVSPNQESGMSEAELERSNSGVEAHGGDHSEPSAASGSNTKPDKPPQDNKPGVNTPDDGTTGGTTGGDSGSGEAGGVTTGGDYGSGEAGGGTTGGDSGSGADDGGTTGGDSSSGANGGGTTGGNSDSGSVGGTLPDAGSAVNAGVSDNADNND